VVFAFYGVNLPLVIQRFFYITIFIFLFQLVHAQATELELVNGKKNTTKKFTTIRLMMSYLDKEVSKLNADGYLEASYDTLRTAVGKYCAIMIAGPAYEWGKVVLKGDPNAIGPKNGKATNHYGMKNIAEKNLTYFENNGFPFASVRFDSISVSAGKINGNMKVDKGAFYKIDSLVIKGNSRLPKIYLQRYLGIKPGIAYSEEQIKQVDKRIKEIPYVSPIKASEVLFTPSQSRVYVYLKKRNASSFNGIVGILPNIKTGKTVITGDARVILKNALGKAETFDLNWRKVANLTQDLKVNLQIPFMFSSPIGTDLFFKLFKRDTSFLELNRTLGLTWQMNRGNFFRVFYNRYNSDILAKTIYTTGTNALLNADVGINQYGIGLRLEKLDYRLNPRKGIALTTDAAAGVKTLKPNAANDATLYASEQLKTDYYTGNLTCETYIPIAKMFTLKLANQTRAIFNQKIYKNELMRLGGIKNLRGFDEESIPTSAFSVFTAEYRLLFEENSALFVFFDQGWYENKSTAQYVRDMPYGFGAGMNFQVKTGVFTFTWALGKQLNNPILIKNSKLHFGFINYF
jgi:outer membrane protein assembly factor BamA